MVLVLWAAASGAAVEKAPPAPPIPLGGGVRVRNLAEPFDYFSNSWTVIGLKDYVHGTRITPTGELVLADGLTCRPVIGKAMVPLSPRVRKVLRKGWVPIVRIDLLADETVRYTIEALACPLERQWQARYDWPAADNYLNAVRVTLTNRGGAPAEAGFGLQWRRKGKDVPCRLDRAGSPRRPAVCSGKAQLCLLDVPPGAALAVAGSRVAITASLPAGASASVVAWVPFRPVSGASAERLAAQAGEGFDTWAKRTESFWQGLLDRGAGLSVPEAKPLETYRASTVYQFIGRDRGDVRAGEGFYDALYPNFRSCCCKCFVYVQNGPKSSLHLVRFLVRHRQVRR